MYTQRCNEYPPMNGFGYNHESSANPGGYVANTNNRDVSNFTLQQHNMHGGNDLRFADGSVPYGFYDQSNFSGINSAVCGAVQNDPRFRSPGSMMPMAHPNNYPMNNRMNDNYGHMPIPQRGAGYGRKFGTAYNHECNYNAGGMVPLMKSKMNGNVQDNKKNVERKNISKLKKGGIDINIETSSGRRQGITVDLNIDIDN